MAAPTIYKTADGMRVPGVTTIIGRFKRADGLIRWAHKVGLEGKDLDEARTPAANAGTLAHKLVEHHINGWAEPKMDASIEVISAARKAFDNFLQWQRQSKLTFRHTEAALVSEANRYGGRLDNVVVEPDGATAIGDIKTGPTYPDHLLQVAAYRELWCENFPKDKVKNGAHIFSFNRETGDFSHRYFDDLTHETNVFLTMRRLYEDMKPIERRAR